jgi:hypothetical protein
MAKLVISERYYTRQNVKTHVKANYYLYDSIGKNSKTLFLYEIYTIGKPTGNMIIHIKEIIGFENGLEINKKNF